VKVQASIVMTLVACVFASPASAQQPPIPSKPEIMKKLKENFPKVLEKSEEVSATFEGAIKLTYKKMPTDPKDVAKMLGKELGTDKIPDGMLDQYIGMFSSQITEVLNEALKNIGEFEALKPIKVRSKKIPVGKHRFGLVFKGEKPAGIVVFDLPLKKGEKEDKEKKKSRMKKPVVIKLKTKSTEPQKHLKFVIKEPKKKKKGTVAVDIFVTCLRYKAKTKKPLIVE
jgi:hypothetical protein